MTAIEITLLILILLLLLGLKYYGHLVQLMQLVQNLLRTNQPKSRWLVRSFKAIARLLRRLRRFSLVYLCKSKFYRLYLALAIAIVSLKVGFFFSPNFQQMSPRWVERGIDFLIVSAAWELICIVIKMIDDYTAKG